MRMKRESFRSGVLRDIFKQDKEFLKQLQEARTNLVTYIDIKKLFSLFVECIDNCAYVDFNDKRDRRVNKSNPVFKVKIKWEAVPKDVMEMARSKKSVADAKTNIIRVGVVSVFVDKIHAILQDPNSEYLKEKLPPEEVRESIKDFIFTLFMLDASDDAMRPVYIRYIM